MPGELNVKIASAPSTLNDLWVFDTLIAKAGDTVRWESNGQESILFTPCKGLFEGSGILPDQQVFAIDAQQGYRLEARLKSDLGEQEETILIPYAIFRLPAQGTASAALHGKVIIKR